MKYGKHGGIFICPFKKIMTNTEPIFTELTPVPLFLPRNRIRNSVKSLQTI
jgi:hypothetical protein